MDCFLTLQNQLFEQLNSLWESDDEEILEKLTNYFCRRAQTTV